MAADAPRSLAVAVDVVEVVEEPAPAVTLVDTTPPGELVRVEAPPPSATVEGPSSGAAVPLAIAGTALAVEAGLPRVDTALVLISPPSAPVEAGSAKPPPPVIPGKPDIGDGGEEAVPGVLMFLLSTAWMSADGGTPLGAPPVTLPTLAKPNVIGRGGRRAIGAAPLGPPLKEVGVDGVSLSVVRGGERKARSIDCTPPSSIKPPTLLTVEPEDSLALANAILDTRRPLKAAEPVRGVNL